MRPALLRPALLSSALRHGLVAVVVAALTVSLMPGAHAEEATGESSTTSQDPASKDPASEDPASEDPASEDPATRELRVRLKVGTRARRPVETTRSWARKMLGDEGVSTDRNDLVRVVRGGSRVKARDRRRLRDDDTVRVVRVATRTHRFRTRLRQRTRTRFVTYLAPGRRKVVASGRAGIRRVTVRRTLHNGRVVRAQHHRTMLRTRRARRVVVGRAYPTVPGGAERMNWRALARCESGNNPRAVNPSGTYHGLYQFDRRTWASVGGSGVASRASAAEQTYRAKRLFRQRGRQPWPHCGRHL